MHFLAINLLSHSISIETAEFSPLLLSGLGAVSRGDCFDADRRSSNQASIVPCIESRLTKYGKRHLRMFTKSNPISRRDLLRGPGVSIALPWLESLPFMAAAPNTAAQPPTRTLVTFTGMGFHSDHWWAKGEGDAMELGPRIKPLEPWKQQLVFLCGLRHEQANNGVIHCMQTGNMLSGA